MRASAGDALDQTLAAARDDDVHVVLHGDQLAHCRTVGDLDHLHRRLGQPGSGQALAHACGDRLVGTDRLGAAAQDRGIPRLQAQARGVRGDVGAGFIDDGHHAERHTHAADLNAGGPVSQVGDLPHRIAQLGDLAQAFRHRGYALGREREPVDHRRLGALGTRCLQVLPVGLQQARAVALDGGGHAQERGVLGPRRCTRRLARSPPRFAADAVHVGLNVHMCSSPRQLVTDAG